MGKKLLLVVSSAILCFWWIPASGQAIEGCPQGTVEIFEPGKTSPGMEAVSLCQSSVHYRAMMDGTVVGEFTFQLEEIDVIIQMEGEPLARLKGGSGAFVSRGGQFGAGAKSPQGGGDSDRK